MDQDSFIFILLIKSAQPNSIEYLTTGRKFTITLYTFQVQVFRWCLRWPVPELRSQDVDSPGRSPGLPGALRERQAD